MLIVMYVLVLYLKVNPYLFPYSNGKELGTLSLIIFFTSVLIPAIAILLMLGVGFIKSLEMKDRTERVGPLIVVAICYIWLYLNIRTHNAIPIPYANFILGSVLALFMSFFINNFVKISLHGVGIGGLVMASCYLITTYGKGYISMDAFGSSFQLHNILILALCLLLAGIILTSRLYLKAHTNQEIMMGCMVGVLGQLLVILFF